MLKAAVVADEGVRAAKRRWRDLPFAAFPLMWRRMVAMLAVIGVLGTLGVSCASPNSVDGQVQEATVAAVAIIGLFEFVGISRELTGGCPGYYCPYNFSHH
jgi:hypothetical protein